jgi:hypothetical protein
MAALAGDAGEAAHEGAADAEDVEMHRIRRSRVAGNPVSP